MTEKAITGLPVLPLRDMVVYPHSVHPLFVGTDSSIRALDAAMSAGKHVLLVAKRDAGAERVGAEDLFPVGTLATILQLLKLPDGTVKVLVEGERRARIARLDFEGAFVVADVETVAEPPQDSPEARKSVQIAMSQFEEYVQIDKKVPQEVLSTLSGIDEPARLIDAIASHMALSVKERQAVLETFEFEKRIELVQSLMESRFDVQRLQKDIRGRVKKQMEKSQREYYLNEQIKAIQKELGEIHEGARRDRSTGGESRRGAHAQGGQGEGAGGVGQAETDGADVSRGNGGARLPRLAPYHALEETQPRTPGPAESPADSR